MAYPRMTAEKFWANHTPEPTTGCWLWGGPWLSDNYGATTWLGKQDKAHRKALELSGRPVPPGKMGCHRCDNRACINPDHLYVGDYQSNATDKVVRGR